MAMHPAQFIQTLGTQLFWPPFRKKSKRKTWEWDQLYSEKQSKRQQEQTYSFSGLGAAKETPVFGDVYYADMSELPSTKWVHARYSLGAILPNEMIDDSKDSGYIDFVRDLASSMGDGHSYARDVAAAFPLVGAFSTFVTYDGVALCGSHVTKSGLTVNNALPAASLSYSAVWDAVLFFETSVFTEDGLPYFTSAKKLIVHPLSLPAARLIVENEFEPNTVNRNQNLLPGLTIVTCRYIPTGYWFVVGENASEDFIYWNRQEPSVVTGEDFDRHAVKFKSISRFSFGPRDYREIVGNPGP